MIWIEIMRKRVSQSVRTKRQQQNKNQIDYLCNENQKLKNNLSTYKQNLIELADVIKRIANEIDDF